MIVIKVNYTTDAPIIKVNYDDAPIYISTSVDATYISVDYGSGAATNAVWGDITGTLSNQTDLQNALDAKVPYTGAIANVDLGEYELKAGQVEFDQTPTGTAGVAVTRWNDTVGTIETTLKGGNVILRHGRDMFERVVNKTGIQLTKAAYQAVRISDAQGQRLAVQLAQANNDNNSADTIGLVVETIDNNQEGYIYTVGELQNINTTGSLQGETWADGDVLYLSPTTAGRITNVKPVAPQHLVVIGYVVYAHQNNGKIFVKITNGFELGELHDVNTTGATNGQVLTYNGTIWTPQTNAAGNIYNTDGTLTGNRTVTMGTNTLSFTRDLLVNGITVGIGNIGDNTRYNTVLGWRALFNPTSKSRNTAIGSESLTSATTGSYNTAVGNESLYALTTGTENTAVGDLGLDSVTTGAGNVSLGAFAMRHLVTGNYNIGIGYDTNLGVDTTAGSYNTLLGAQSTIGDTSGSNNTVLGARINASGNYSNNIILGDGSGNMRLVFNSSGDAILGGSTTYPTFSGFKLDVLGSGRFSGNLTTNVTANSIVKTNASGVLTAAIAGTDYQLPITNPITGTGANGQVAYWSGTNTQTGSNNLFWDNTNGRLGIGTNAPANALDVRTTSGTIVAAFKSQFTQTGYIGTDNSSIWLGIGGTDAYNNALVVQNTGNNLLFRTNNVQVARFFSTGNLLLQSGGTFTDGGQRLQVQGDAFIKGSGNTSGSTALTVQNSDGTAMLRLRNDGYIQIGAASTFPYIAPINRVTTGVSLTGEGILFQSNGNSVGTDFAFSGNNITATSGVLNLIFLGKSFIPTSGTAAYTQLIFQPIINQTGGANGITRGLYVNPTLTAAADWRSIEWSNNTGWGLYGAGTCANYLNGRLALGTTTTSTGVLSIGANLTGGTTQRITYLATTIQSDVTGTAYGIQTAIGTAGTVFTLSDLFHYQSSQASFGGGSVVTNQYGFAVSSNLIGATNNYGFYGNIPSGTGRWNLYMNGTANNYMAGNLGIGSTSLADSTLRLGKNMTGGTTYTALYNDGTIQTDVTVSGIYYRTQARTAASVAVTNIVHYYAQNLTLGSSSTVTNQFGYHADSGIIGATNNYGFYGNIASGTGRWNFFANGTAANYLNGNTIIGGSAVDGGQKLQVNGDSIMTGSGNTSGTTALTVRNSDGTNLLRLRNDLNTSINYVRFGNSFSTSSYVFPYSSNEGVPDAAGTNLSFYNYTGSGGATAGTFTFSGNPFIQTSGSQIFLRTTNSFAPTSGTASLDIFNIRWTINQTGGANGITRGLFVNPTLTSAADWRSVEMSNNSGWGVYQTGASANNYFAGDIGLGTTTVTNWLNIGASTTAKAHINLAAGSAPTAPANGDIWFDGTDLKMRIGGVTKTFTLV